ncbi:MAG: diacylglycerol kinase [Sulfurimonas sp.]|uniref:diacylglycerol kinase n=1 Tax=Sulfurimonas sp. TaxID=2022749 RepID=UPI003D0A41C6
MRNQPKYNFFKNTSYALKGLRDLVKNESSFKLELLLFLVLLPLIFFIETTLSNKLLMFISLMLMLIAEATNSAIERVVDLVTLEHHEMAGRAKDVGSTVVFLSISLFVVVWGSIILDTFL